MRRNHWFGVGVLFALVGSGVPQAEAKGSVQITFTTTPSGGVYAPNNVVAAWIQNGAGSHLRTVGLWSAVRTQYLVSYRAAAGANDANMLTADAVSSASRLDHQGALSVIWNLRDKAGNIVPDGTYTIRLELADENATTAGQNNQATFTFVKGATPQTQTGLAQGGFTGVTIAFDPQRVACGDGVVDAPNESCDYTVQGSCVVNQSGCASADKCMPAVFQGSPMACTADCVVMPITQCIDGDGCCLDTCTEANDSDCIPGNTGGDGDGDGDGSSDLGGGCSTSTSGGFAMFAMFALLAGRKYRAQRRRVVRHDAVRAERQ